MKAIKPFKYSLTGNDVTTINEGDEIPEIALEYAKKNDFCAPSATKQAKKPANKAAQPPSNKA